MNFMNFTSFHLIPRSFVKNNFISFHFTSLVDALHRTNFGGTIEPKKFAKSTSKEHEKGNWYKKTSGFLGLNLFLEKKI